MPRIQFTDDAVLRDGVEHKRIPYGKEKRYGTEMAEILKDYPLCPDCRVEQGAIHSGTGAELNAHLKAGSLNCCDMEECPMCGNQLLCCSCVRPAPL